MSTGQIAADELPSQRALRWHDWLVLVALIGIGSSLRFYQITKVGLWPDEFWSSVHLATGRGTSVFDLPSGVLFDPPPPTLLVGAPPWWRIWTGLKGIVHPPLYLILLRWWMDLFGTADLATRAFSAIASLAGVVVLFDSVRRMISTRAGLLAASLMALSPLQIDLSQQTRPYCLLLLVGLLACHALIRIERDGPSMSRLVPFSLALIAMMLTHYFCLGAVLAIAAYVTLRFRGSNRNRTLAAIAAAMLFVAICWGPFIWQQHREFFRQGDWSLEPVRNPEFTLIRLASIPATLLFGRPDARINWLAPAVVAYFLPAFLLRRRPQLLLPWLWILFIVGSIAAYDLINGARLLAYAKYVALASVGLYALCAAPLPSRKGWRWLIGYLMVAAVTISAIERIQEGPPPDNRGWCELAQAVDRLAGQHDALVFYPDKFWGPPGMFYLDVAHYAIDKQRPVMFLDSPAHAVALAQLARFKTIWLIGPSPGTDGEKYLPGWKIVLTRWFPASGAFAELKPNGPLPSRPTRP